MVPESSHTLRSAMSRILASCQYWNPLARWQFLLLFILMKGNLNPKRSKFEGLESTDVKLTTQKMIAILNRSTSDVTFVVQHPVLHRDCARQGLSWMAVDHPTPNLGLKCVSKMTSSCKDDIVVTADCVNGVAIGDVDAFSHGPLGQIDGRALVTTPPPSRVSRFKQWHSRPT